MNFPMEKLFETQIRVARIKSQAEDRTAIKDECDKISAIIKKVIEDGTAHN